MVLGIDFPTHPCSDIIEYTLDKQRRAYWSRDKDKKQIIFVLNSKPVCQKHQCLSTKHVY